MSLLADQFSTEFRQEHRAVRDRLLDLVGAFGDRNLPATRSLLTEIAGLTGPHFRYEEESLYPDLVAIFGPDYVDQLLRDHDRAIDNARRLVALVGQDELSADDVAEGVHLARAILPHVSDCDGLSIMVEKFTDAQIQAVFDTRQRSLAEGLSLLDWASTIRQRQPLLVH